MASKRKFYRVVFQTEVLIDTESTFNDTPNWDLESVHYEITNGGCSGNIQIVESQEVSAPDMAQMLLKQGSDPEFFSIDEDGNDYDPEGFISDGED